MTGNSDPTDPTLPNDAFWVYEGTVMAGPYPGSESLETARRDISELVEAGARTFIDLTEVGELFPYAPLLDEIAADRSIDCTHNRFPIPDLGTPDEDTLVETLATIRQAASAERAAYVHCWGGVGRTGTVVGCLLREDGLAEGEILAHLRDLRAGTLRGELPAPETTAQRELVLGWGRRSPG